MGALAAKSTRYRLCASREWKFWLAWIIRAQTVLWWGWRRFRNEAQTSRFDCGHEPAVGANRGARPSCIAGGVRYPENHHPDRCRQEYGLEQPPRPALC